MNSPPCAPPPYNNYNATSFSNDDRIPLTVPSAGSRRGSRYSWNDNVCTRKNLLVLISVLFFSLFVAQNLGYVFPVADGVSAAKKARLRREWDHEKAVHETETVRWGRDRETHRVQLELIKAEIEEMQHEWESWKKTVEAQRAAWARERQEEERHRKEIEHRRQGVWWGDKWGGKCTEFGVRAYHADLWNIPGDLNWLEVCMDMPIQLNGKPIDRPDKCERNNKGHVTATWFIKDDPECTMYWDKLYDKGCSAGQSGMRRYEARLMNLKRGEDWDRMCRTTPANIYGLHYDHPTVCEDKNGRTGVWDYPDPECW